MVVAFSNVIVIKWNWGVNMKKKNRGTLKKRKGNVHITIILCGQ